MLEVELVDAEAEAEADAVDDDVSEDLSILSFKSLIYPSLSH